MLFCFALVSFCGIFAVVVNLEVKTGYDDFSEREKIF